MYFALGSCRSSLVGCWWWRVTVSGGCTVFRVWFAGLGKWYNFGPDGGEWLICFERFVKS